MKPYIIRPLLMASSVLLWARVGPAQSTAPSIPTQADIRGQVEAGDFAGALRGLARVLELKGPAAVPYNRPEMLVLRGECFLQTRQSANAKTALEEALKEAVAAGDSVTAGNALALSTLFSKSSNMTYSPKKGTAPVAPKPINILDRAARPEAYKALYDDLLPETRTKTRAALQSQSMTAVMSAARDAAVLRAVEKLVAPPPPDPADAQKIAADLLEHADDLVATSLNQMTLSARAIAANANQIEAYNVQSVDPVTHLRTINTVGRRRGLANNESQTLKSMLQTCGQINSSLTELAVEFASPETFKEHLGASNDLQRMISGILNDDYTLLRR
jgi:hypothetical protein